MNTHIRHRSLRNPRSNRRGITLLDLVVSTASATVLIGGLTSAVYLAAEAANPKTESSRLVEVSTIADEIASELRAAISVRTRSATSIEFDVADRDADGDLERISYTWNGTAGSSLVRSYNATATTLLSDVHGFALAYTTQPTARKANALLVVVNSGILNTQEQFKRRTIESWGYYVVPISANSSRGALTAAAAAADVIFVSANVDVDRVERTLRKLPTGLVNEEPTLNEMLGLTDDPGTNYLAQGINVLNNSHYITTSLPTGTVNLFDTPNRISYSLTAPITGSTTLARKLSTTNANLVVADAGVVLFGGGVAPARRVALPWGGTALDGHQLNSNGLLILRRSLEWASGDYLLTRVSFELQAGSSGKSRVAVQADLTNRPRTCIP